MAVRRAPASASMNATVTIWSAVCFLMVLQYYSKGARLMMLKAGRLASTRVAADRE